MAAGAGRAVSPDALLRRSSPISFASGSDSCRPQIGNFGHAYFVLVQCPQSGEKTIEKFAQFIGEISSDDERGNESADSFTSEECAKRRTKAVSVSFRLTDPSAESGLQDYVYTRVPSHGTISGVPYKDVWTPAQVLVGHVPILDPAVVH